MREAHINCHQATINAQSAPTMKKLVFSISILALLLSCTRPATPKEYGYFRIALPPHEYINSQSEPTMRGAQQQLPKANNNAPLVQQQLPKASINYQLSTAAQLQPLDSPGWFNIHYPALNATIHCSYMPVHNNLKSLIDDSEEFVYSHTVKASAIPEQAYSDPVNRVYGVYYELEGNTATPAQFWVTDSTRHFFRASVYIDCIPNQDSLAPVIDYLQTDCRVLIESLRWQ